MELEKLYERLSLLTERSHQKGCSHVRYYIEQAQNFRINIYRQEVDQYSLSDTCQIFMEAEYQGFRGATYFENPDESIFDELVSHLIDTATANQEPFTLKPFPSKETSSGDTLEPIDPEQAISLMKEADKLAYSLDPRVDNVNFCLLSQSQRVITLIDETGSRPTDRTGFVLCEVDVVAKETKDNVESVQTSYSEQFGKSLSQLDPKQVAREAVERTVSLLHAKSVPSGSYPVILQNRAAGQILSAFQTVFSAETIQNGMSFLLKGKTGQTVASPLFTLEDNPSKEGGLVSRTFDDEGTPTSKKYLIRDGVLETILYNNRSAEKDGALSTGSGFKPSYRDNCATSSTNLSVKPGSSSFEDLVSHMGHGIVITSVDGLHAGVHPASGTFSLIAQGYLVENGKISRPVSQITVGGSLLGALEGIQEIGSDVETVFSSVNANEFFSTPSLRIRQLTIGGE